jgi:hypothetical protein
MDQIARAVDAGVDESVVNSDGGTEIGKFAETTKGRGGFLPNDGVVAQFKLIIPRGGILGSNLSPATNLETPRSRGSSFNCRDFPTVTLRTEL